MCKAPDFPPCISTTLIICTRCTSICVFMTLPSKLYQRRFIKLFSWQRERERERDHWAQGALKMIPLPSTSCHYGTGSFSSFKWRIGPISVSNLCSSQNRSTQFLLARTSILALLRAWYFLLLHCLHAAHAVHNPYSYLHRASYKPPRHSFEICQVNV